MAVITAIAVGATVAAGAAAAAIAKKKAADKAAKAQKKGIAQQEKLLNQGNPEALNKLAAEADESRARRRLALQQSIDPELAALRQKGKEELLREANIPRESRKSEQLARTLFEETKTADPRLEALKTSLIENARSELAAGATLPPEFQAELVRTGLSKGSQAGILADKSTIGGTVARAVGLAGIQLQQQRQDQAMQLANAAQNITNSRVNILSTVFPKLRELEAQDRAEAAQNFALGNATLPESGLSGQDVVNLKLAQIKGKANLAGQRAGIKAQQAINTGQFQSELIGAGVKGVTSVAGGLGGIGGGASGIGTGTGGLLGVGGTGATVDIGQYGARTPAQQSNFNFLQSYYQ